MDHEHENAESRDIDMWSDSPAKPAQGSAGADTRADSENENTVKQSKSANEAKPTLLSSILRPINANAVKRVEKQRSKTHQQQQQQRSANRAVSAGSGAANRGAMVLRAADGEDENLLSEDGDSELSDDEEYFDVSIASTHK
ncbi:hypothetical protein QFC22_002851 [Naganishia vaughanmartiniae]|uniref:Uncharacterized protein n=1 Tax=Naganishia vaughanmartiniae TaxID=1424756 RepID=A0ACC2XC25_9TREE|nr:hypothetical protein QFC22_002851 [Naganishia vaughanmartiniae]